jgi:hypothetical protein|tara:strand:- start:142 stop:588 length:447 start_codon:yes stop_codon:yes gene_type:complete
VQAIVERGHDSHGHADPSAMKAFAAKMSTFVSTIKAALAAVRSLHTETDTVDAFCVLARLAGDARYREGTTVPPLEREGLRNAAIAALVRRKKATLAQLQATSSESLARQFGAVETSILASEKERASARAVGLLESALVRLKQVSNDV